MKILIIGAGVSGLTTALCLLREGYGVKIIADKFSPDTTSNVAGALWEMPPAICGMHNGHSMEIEVDWCKKSLREFEKLSKNPDTGVRLRRSNFYSTTNFDDSPDQCTKIERTRECVQGFERGAYYLDRSISVDIKDAYSYLCPVIDTDTYLRWLTKEVRLLGGELEEQRIEGHLREILITLLGKYEASIIINCSGLESRKLCRDTSIYPLRGAVVRVVNDGSKFPVIDEAHCMTEKDGFVFILPRNDRTLLLGGFAEKDEWDTGIGLDYNQVSLALDRCKEFMPCLENAELDQEPLRVGLRPYRENVRLEIEGTNLVHNYGHGGSGVTYSWGCASQVVKLAKKLRV